MEKGKKEVIIVAGGKGLRMGGDIPKQFRVIGDSPVLMHTLKAFYRYDNDIHIILVLPREQREYWNGLCRQYRFTIPHTLVDGGETRFASVRNGLEAVSPAGLVAVHDGVRPFVSQKVIAEAFTRAAETGAAIPVIEVTDSLREIRADGNSRSVPRQQYKSVQTPQVFRSDLLKEAYRQPYSEQFTDDASVAESAGYTVCLVPGNTENIKITTPQDLLLAEFLANHA
ncbi:MAG: 2-C-methyl-D-erythritol 4-phosphate cytidylyltransferase [Coprobacter sp.]|nr:2-C-methyl-D-erythritol 4-phosphate cytidylyltransferase [Coprobacter sp.]